MNKLIGYRDITETEAIKLRHIGFTVRYIGHYELNLNTYEVLL